MGPDLRVRLAPFTAVVLAVAVLTGRPRWLGLGLGEGPAQLVFGATAGAVLFVGAALLQLLLTRRVRGTVKVPAEGSSLALEAGYYVVNALVEEAFFRGLLQGGLTALAGPALGLGVGTATYVLYHRLGRWTWSDVLATVFAGVPLALGFWLLPGPPSLLGVSLAHACATCGFLGPGPWLLRRLRLI